MGVLNVTPDSFSDGGRYDSMAAAVRHGFELAAAGADLIDVGGESTRPGAQSVAADEEVSRILPVVTELAAGGLRVSIDTTKPEVARAALDAGAVVVNDVSALSAPAMASLVEATGSGVVLMHMQGEPRTMQDDPRYDDVVIEVRDFLLDRARRAEQEGIRPDRIAIDPGIGFGKTLEHNLALLRDLQVLVETGYAVLLGTSRKAFLGRILGETVPAAERDPATGATVALAMLQGVAAVRVHNVAMTTQIVRTVETIIGRRH